MKMCDWSANEVGRLEYLESIEMVAAKRIRNTKVWIDEVNRQSKGDLLYLVGRVGEGEL